MQANTRVLLIIQARMGSSRLPGKVLREVLGQPLLKLQIARLEPVTKVCNIVVATTDRSSDDVIVEFCKKFNVDCFRGSELDVLSRYYHCAKDRNANIVVRLTADCPLIDPKVILDLLAIFQSGKYDYVSNTLQRTFPRGMDAEVFSFKTLERCFYDAKTPHQREHVTPYIYENPEKFKLGSLLFKSDQSMHRWTVDTEEDLELITKIIKKLHPRNPNYTLDDALLLLSKHQDWAAINAHIEQKKEQKTKVFFRVDASLKIGTGHVMRCLCLAEELKKNGCDVVFICRELSGNLISLIEEKWKFLVLKLERPKNGIPISDSPPDSILLETTWEVDAKETINKIQANSERVDLLVIDHYAIDFHWESILKKIAKKIIVIDDRANRKHEADILIDQNYFQNSGLRYKEWVSQSCLQLLGPKYSFLRNEFLIQKQKGVSTRNNLNRIMIFFGGVDATQETIKTLGALLLLQQKEIFIFNQIDIVVGQTNNALNRIQQLSQQIKGANVLTNVQSMAELMAVSDLALGAGGITTWERCCMGLPTVAISIADNQEESLGALSNAGYLQYLGRSQEVSESDIAQALVKFSKDFKKLAKMSIQCASLTDGLGTKRIVETCLSLS